MVDSSPLLRFSLASDINKGHEPSTQSLTIQAKEDTGTQLDPSLFDSIPDGAKTAIWADFELLSQLDPEEIESLVRAIRAVIEDFFYEARAEVGGSYLSFSARTVDEGGRCVFRVSLFFGFNFRGVLTRNNQWLEAVSLLQATLQCSGPMLADEGTSTVHSLQSLMELDRKLFAPDSLDSMPPAVRSLVDSLQDRVPEYVQNKLEALQNQGGSDALPVNQAEVAISTELDADMSLFPSELRQKLSGIPVNVPDSVKAKLGGLLCMRLRAESSACIDIELEQPEALLQCIGCAVAANEPVTDASSDARELWDCAKNGNKVVLKQLLNAKVNPDECRDGSRATALIKASINGRLEAVELLLGASAAIDLADESGMTPLMAAVMGGHNEVAKLLLSSGADPAIRDLNGDTAADLSSPSCEEELVSRLQDGALETSEEGDGKIHTTVTVVMDEFATLSLKQEQSVELSAVVDSAVDFSDIERPALEGSKTLIALELAICQDLDPVDATVLESLISQTVEAGLAANEEFLGSEVLIDGNKMLITIHLSMDSFELILEQGPWLKFLAGVKASFEMSQSMAALFSDMGSELGKHVGRIHAEIDVYEALLTSDALETVPPGISGMIPPGVVEQLDNQVPPIRHADTSFNVVLNRERLLKLFSDEVSEATTAKILELGTKVPVTIARFLSELTEGIKCLRYRSAGNAAVDLVMEPPIPVFDVLPTECEDIDGGWEEDDEEEQAFKKLMESHPIQDGTSPKFLERTPSLQRTAEDLATIYHLLSIEECRGSESSAN